jgi:quercetin dioxygenase-like cupin family protein
MGTVVDGTVEWCVAGKDPRRYAPGDAFANPRGVVHQFANVGDGPARLITTPVAGKGKPRTVMRPAPQ